jgi:hydrogenase 3 maturation protease
MTCRALEELKRWLSKAERVVVAGVGNTIRTDDSVGVKLVQDLHGKVSEKVHLIECETVPESFIQHIIDFKPTHVILVDAAILGLKPGECRFIKPDQLKAYPAISTHMLPLKIFCEYIEKTTKAEVGLLLIEPKCIEFGEGLSPEIATAKKEILDVLLEALNQLR